MAANAAVSLFGNRLRPTTAAGRSPVEAGNSNGVSGFFVVCLAKKTRPPPLPSPAAGRMRVGGALRARTVRCGPQARKGSFFDGEEYLRRQPRVGMFGRRSTGLVPGTRPS